MKYPSCACEPARNTHHVPVDRPEIPIMCLWTGQKYPSCACGPARNTHHVPVDRPEIPIMCLWTGQKYPSCACGPAGKKAEYRWTMVTTDFLVNLYCRFCTRAKVSSSQRSTGNGQQMTGKGHGVR
ncbi:hypothetical protein TNCV_2231931 [Trichonephila clavipes]|nr:hypothetical protein TNCV_2231931 [Trichonephila clavipes]